MAHRSNCDDGEHGRLPSIPPSYYCYYYDYCYC
jgi:hypothetical protein